MLRKVDSRDDIYTKTRLRTSSTDQWSRRPPHHKKYMRIVNYFISRHPGTRSIITRGPGVFSNHTKALPERHLGWRRPLSVLPLTPTYPHLRLE
ncbi:uncharacterized protein TNCV_422861 [Trichonephila clavipes]|nr:uncharacterized protein TNCV_422861 [Trichonephila clavipes]